MLEACARLRLPWRVRASMGPLALASVRGFLMALQASPADGGLGELVYARREQCAKACRWL